MVSVSGLFWHGSRRSAALFAAMMITALACGSQVHAADEASPASPFEVISETATNFQASLSGKEAYYSDNLDELYEVVGNELQPVLDMRYAGYLALGSHWSGATETQRSRFVDAFAAFLIRTYAKGLLEFNQDNLKILGQSFAKDRKRAEVKTELNMANGSKVLVDYRLRNSNAGWRVYDVRIDGVSYIQNYRSQFNAEINALGLDALIERLEQDVEVAEPVAES